MERNRKKKKRKEAAGVRAGAIFLLILLLVFAVFLRIKIGADASDKQAPKNEGTTTPVASITSLEQELYTADELGAVTVVEPSVEPTYQYQGDPDNLVYPFNTMSADWGAEIYEEGFKYYEIPDEYVRGGGCFPEVVQVYLWSLCKQRNIDYYMVVALIERESAYKWDAAGDGGNSLGYMQIGKRWHEDRMAEEAVADLLNPYGNIRVGLNFIQELNERYLESSGANCVLMVYNMGASQAKSWWAKGVYSTEYSRGVLVRAEEIKQELEQV